ncbi:hypothetical protein [Pinirhizobacter sp.]|uniref:hypothetical protein n=1 Tax=Pinirhizobacter sp. TaxID=2950432 RepID=UPI002F414669
MGGAKKQTVGYWYNWAMLFGWCKGPIDAFLEFRAGGLTAWTGRLTASGRLHINKPDLWGGEDTSGQGGLVGDLDVMFGEATQVPNDYMLQTFGERQSARRGKLSTCWRGGKFGAFVSNPKAVSAKVERILADWQDGVVWYPEKAVIELTDGSPLPADAEGWEYQTLADEADPGNTNLVPPASGWQPGQAPFAGGTLAGDGNTDWPIHTVLWARRTVTVPSGATGTRLRVQAENGCVVFIDGAVVGAVNQPNADLPNNQNNTFYFDFVGGRTYQVSVKAFDEKVAGGGTFLSAGIVTLRAMNPAHMIYDSITHADMQGEPAGIINDASFRATADKLWNEQFGLCTDYDSDSETPQQFQQRLCNVIGASLSQSRVDGLYYLDLIRGDYDLDSLPIIGEDDVITFSQDPSVITETGNRLSVEWLDPQAKETRTTAPMFAMGNVRSAGRVIPADTKQYHEIPVESLALRCCARDLKAVAVPFNRLTLGTKATMRGLRPGQNARVQLPSEGIGDMVVVVGSVQHGTATDGQMKLVLAENIYGMPDTTYISGQPGSWTPPDNTPLPSPLQLAIEAPYVELVASLSDAELAAVTPDAGYLLTIAGRAPNGPNYLIASAAGGEDYVTSDIADWCPTAEVVPLAGPLDEAFAISAGVDLDRVALGSWAQWDDEIVRVDAIDVGANTLTLGRGCADTTPRPHAAGSRVFFAGEWGGTDSRAYVGGDAVRAKLLTRTRTGTLALDDAPELDVVMADRAYRPYAPGRLQINGLAYPASLVGELTTTWSHRDRILQADQLIDTTAADVGPEAGTTYTVRYYQPPGALVATEAGVAGTSAAPYTFPGDGTAAVAVSAVRDGIESWQALAAVFAYTVSPSALRITEGGDIRITESGDARALESP